MKKLSLSLLFVWFVVSAPSQGSAQSARLTVRVVAPPQTPREAVVFIAGDLPAMGAWDPGKVAMARENDTLWSFAVPLPLGHTVQFKITRGSWLTEAIYTDGVIPSNIVVRVGADTIVTLKPVTWNDLSAARARNIGSGGITGTVRYHRGLAGDGLKFARDVLVWLPPSYEKEQGKRYPVLYMHDGQNVFDPSTSFIGSEWRADEVADSLIKAGAIDEIIIVGINNSPDRIEEYSDTQLGRRYAAFVVDRVKPLIDSLYRTLPDAPHTGVMGSSMGGLISLLFVWWYPDTFSMAGCLSTSIIPGRFDSILNEIREDKGPKKNLRFYFDVGGLERQLIPGMAAAVSTLEKKGYKSALELTSFVDEGAGHNEIAWAKRLWRPLQFMFGR